MAFFRRLFQFLFIVFFAGAVWYFVTENPVLGSAAEEEEEGNVLFSDRKETILLWYTDETLTDYLNREAARFGESSEDTRVLPVLTSAVGFMETVGLSSAVGSDFPDIFITTHDNLEKAALAGLAAEVEHAEDHLRGDTYPPAALNAVTWHARSIAYPFYGETIALLYNRTYLEDQARLEAEENGETLTDEQLAERVQEMLPDTLEDLLDFAGHYNAPDEVEAVFSFDVNDLFTDYFFAGDAIDVGGPAGDDAEAFDLYNAQSLTCMDIYQQLGQFFAIDSKNVDGDKILQDFIDGRMVFTIATTEAVSRIRSAQEAGETDYVFGAAPLFQLTDDLHTRALSVTNCIVVNGFSERMEQAHQFAQFLLNDGSDELYTRAGKMAARYRADFGEDETAAEMMRAYASVYENSVPMPKLLETSNYWIRLEIAFTDIWNGADVNDTMRGVAEALMSQMRGEEVVLEKIETPEQIVISGDLTEESGDQ